MQILQQKASGACWFVAAQLSLSRLTRFPVSGVNGLTLAAGRGVSAGILICPSKRTEPIRLFPTMETDETPPFTENRVEEEQKRSHERTDYDEEELIISRRAWPYRQFRWSTPIPFSPCGPIYISLLGLHDQRGHSRLAWAHLGWVQIAHHLPTRPSFTSSCLPTCKPEPEWKNRGISRMHC